MATIAVQQSNQAHDSWDGANTIATTLTSIASGEVVAACVSWEGGDATVSVSDGTTSFTAGTKAGPSADQYMQWFYLLTPNTGNKTITASGLSGRTMQTISAYRISIDSGTLGIDVEKSNTGTTTSLTTGNTSTTGTDVIVLASGKVYTNATFSSPAIAGSAATALTHLDSYAAYNFYRVTTLSNQASTCTASASGGNTIIALISFKGAADGGASATTKFAKPAAIMRGMYRGMWLENDWLKPTGGN